MTLNKVTLTCDLYDGAGNPVVQGTGTLVPTTVLTDSSDQVIAGLTPVPVPFRAGGLPQVSLLATDNSGLLPSGWAWTFTPPAATGIAAFNVPLAAGPFSFTATNASPCVFSAPGYAAGYVNGTAVTLAGGSLPAGFSAATTYYVVAASGTTFELAATPGGAAIGSTSSGSGTVQTTAVHLSALSPVSSAASMQAYLPLPSGTPSAGQVPVATGTGEASAWGTPGTPLTTLGDTIYGGAGGAETRLPGNTSATREFLRQQGTGSASAAPAWDTIQAGDLPAATSGAQGAVQLAGDLGNTAAAPEVLSTHLASPLPVNQGGTGQATQQAAINALSGTQSAGKYLRSDGTNAALAAIQAADLPAATVSAQGAVELAGDLGGTAASPQVTGTHLGSPLPAAQGGSGVFSPMTYGATGNGMIANDGAVTATSTTLTSASLVPFSGTRTVWVPGAGVAGALLQTTLTCTVSGTGTLGTAASTTVSAARIYWGTDDTAAFQAAIAAASPSAGTVLIPPGAYLISQVLAVTLANTGTGNNPQAAPSILGMTGAGFIGDQGLGAAGPAQYATALVALPGFPQGKFLIDYQQAGTPYGPAGARVGGFSLVCNNYSAGFRMQGPREFHVAHMTITGAATPVAPGDTGPANGGFSVTWNNSASAGAYNLFEHITVWASAADNFYDNTNFENTYLACRSVAPGSASYHVGTYGSCNTYIDCHYGGGLYGVQLDRASGASFVGLSVFPNVPWPSKNALLMTGGWQYNQSFFYPPSFVACRFINSPGSGVSEADGAVVRFAASSAYQMGGVFTGCYFGTGTSGFMTDWLYSDANIGGGAGLGGTVTFRDCVFTGTPATKAYNDQSGIMQFFNCTGAGGVAGGSGGLSPVGGSPHIAAAQALTAPATAITFPGIPQGYAVLRILVTGRSAAAAETDQWYIQLNADTGNHYDMQQMYGPGSSSAAGSSGHDGVGAWFNIADMPGASATAGAAGLLDVEIPGYAGTTFQKTGTWRSGYNDAATATTDAVVTAAMVAWRSTAAITSVKIGTISGSGFVAGTTALLYVT